MIALLIAQFLSALADNAVLIVAIAIVKAQGLSQLVPFLQGVFIVPFILLAPFVGQIADSFPKGRVMLWANLLKLSGAVMMVFGLHPLLAYGLIGVGAAVYSPAKYGILSQMVEPALLVRANGMLEGTTIVAILLGVLLGGWLADRAVALAFCGIIASYGLATLANLMIPRLPVENPVAVLAPLLLIRRFLSAVRQLFADPDTRFSLLGTSLFWGSGTTLRLILFAWVPLALSINDNQTPANLMGVVSVGIVLGAVVAGLWISLATVNRALIGGLLLGPVILAMAGVTDIKAAVLLMGIMGLGGGIFVVPLNALLQERGHQSIGAGKALAVQNFFENAVMLLFVSGYSLASASGLSIHHILMSFGSILIFVVLAFAIKRKYKLW